MKISLVIFIVQMIINWSLIIASLIMTGKAKKIITMINGAIFIIGANLIICLW